MQSYHGKGPYDAEGGIVKTRVRRQVYYNRAAFRNALQVHEFCAADDSLCNPKAQPTTGGKQFVITKRFFVHISEEAAMAVALRFCKNKKPAMYYNTGGAVSADPLLKTKSSVFCVRPGPLPSVYVRPDEQYPARLGRVPPAGVVGTCTPYAEETLNLVGQPFVGWWRRLSCGCAACTSHNFGSPQCQAHGSLHQPPAWAAYTVERKPGTSFLDLWIDAHLVDLLTDPEVWTAEALDAQYVTWAQTLRAFKRYRSVDNAKQAVVKRFAATDWVVLCVTRVQARVTSAPPNALVPADAQLLICHALAAIGWSPPGPLTTAEFVANTWARL